MVDIMSKTAVPLDPVYTLKGVRGLLGELRDNPTSFSGNRILYIHTGKFLSLSHTHVHAHAHAHAACTHTHTHTHTCTHTHACTHTHTTCTHTHTHTQVECLVCMMERLILCSNNCHRPTKSLSTLKPDYYSRLSK